MQRQQDKVHLPSEIGAIPRKIASRFDQMKADQWRILFSVLLPFVLHNQFKTKTIKIEVDGREDHDDESEVDDDDIDDGNVDEENEEEESLEETDNDDTDARRGDASRRKVPRTKVAAAATDRRRKKPAERTKTVAIHPSERSEIVRLFVLLSAAITLLFARVAFRDTFRRAQAVLQNYCILFAQKFPMDVKPNMHFAIHLLEVLLAYGKTTVFFFESAIGVLGGFPTNGKDVEGTIAKRWLLQQALQTQGIVFDNVLTPAGEVVSMTLRQMIDQDIFPPSHIAALKLISGKELQRGLGNGGEQGTPTTPYHIDTFYKTSLLHPLRRLHRPDRLLGVFEVMYNLSRVTVHPVLGLHSSALKVFMETDLKFATDSGDLIVEVAALIQEPNNSRTWASANLWKDAFAYSHMGLHSIISLLELPALSQALGGQATCLNLGFCATDRTAVGDPTVFVSRNGFEFECTIIRFGQMDAIAVVCCAAR